MMMMTFMIFVITHLSEAAVGLSCKEAKFRARKIVSPIFTLLSCDGLPV